jgi:hypothetical protein
MNPCKYIWLPIGLLEWVTRNPPHKTTNKLGRVPAQRAVFPILCVRRKYNLLRCRSLEPCPVCPPPHSWAKALHPLISHSGFRGLGRDNNFRPRLPNTAPRCVFHSLLNLLGLRAGFLSLVQLFNANNVGATLPGSSQQF